MTNHICLFLYIFGSSEKLVGKVGENILDLNRLR